MQTSVQRWGNSLALRIPKSFASETRLAAGSPVELVLRSGALVIRPVMRKKPKLGDLLKRMKPGQRHAETDLGGPVGREIW